MLGDWNVMNAFLPIAAHFNLGCSSGATACGTSRADAEDIDAVSPASGLIFPSPAVALEGPADLPKSTPIGMLPVGGGSNSGRTVLKGPVSAALSRQCAQTESPEEARRKTDAASGSRTLRFFPHPSDSRLGAPVDVIEHGFEVLIVRRQPSPTPKCPSSMLPRGDGENGDPVTTPVKSRHSRYRSPGVRSRKETPEELSI
eukprot:TRINITY_DN90446_c0_g1_i1.p1 TRINITY_DN90446_c0_g1~~TRINITY_DN90446_c0_g1_i1.p1  ORF type:complete len:201 (+),score=10.19 TRINITY_DN90446_c0_g1_i1:172-774(+)